MRVIFFVFDHTGWTKYSTFFSQNIMKVRDVITLFVQERDSTKGEPKRFILRAYNAVLTKLRALDPLEELTPTKIKQLHVTDNMSNKLNKITKMSPQKVELRQQLMSVLGIGAKKADDLISAGLSNTRQLKSKKWQEQLPTGAQMIVKYKPLQRIPHAMITELAPVLTKFKGTPTIVGGFRRKKPYSRDIDVLISKKAMPEYVKMLETKFNGLIYSSGSDKASLLIHLKKYNIWVKLDVFGASPPEWVAMLTYGTGSKQFNIRMRAKAKYMGFLLNQSGLFDRKNKTRIRVTSEMGLFKKLNMNWVDPVDR